MKALYCSIARTRIRANACGLNLIVSRLSGLKFFHDILDACVGACRVATRAHYKRGGENRDSEIRSGIQPHIVLI